MLLKYDPLSDEPSCLVDCFTGPSYGKGILVFYYHGEPIQFMSLPATEQQGIHHLEMQGIHELQKRYPTIPHQSDYTGLRP